LKNSKPKKINRFIIGDPNNYTEKYREDVEKLAKRGTEVLNLPGVQGNQPEFSTREELLSSFRALKFHYCQLHLQHRKAINELEKIHSAQFGNKGFLKKFDMQDLHPFYFYRLVALRFKGLSKTDLDSLTARNADKKNYRVKNLSARVFRQHFKIATNHSKWVDLPVQRAKNNLFALKVMAIGVIEDYLGRALEQYERDDFIAESGPFLKKLEQGLIQFTNEELGYATKFLNPTLPESRGVKKIIKK
jgi:hypothetical protein